MIRVWGHTDPGRIRKENQDTFLVSQLTADLNDVGFFLGPASHPTGEGADPSFALGPRGALLVVADGMSGPAGGGRASRLALTALTGLMEREWQKERAATPRSFLDLMVRAVREANQKVHRESMEDPGYSGMGTTLTLAGLLDDTLYMAQIGDSRGYIFRNGSLVQLTRDQSMVQELLDAGVITEAEARVSPQRNVILKALGTEPRVDPVVTFLEMRRGDLILLCSDGLSGLLSSEEISGILSGPGSLQHRCSVLVDSANEAGGPDNITVVLAEVAGEGVPLPIEGERASPRRLEWELS
ncbi:N/A [soil metagenome]